MQLLKGARVFSESGFSDCELAIDGRVVSDLAPTVFPDKDDNLIDFENCIIVPGFVDVHTHLREPGFFYKEGIKTGTKAAAAGGYTAVFAMPNLSPVPDSLENLAVEEELIKSQAAVRVYPLASITRGEKGEALSDIEVLSSHVVGFSDDGRGVQSETLMEEAMERVSRVNGVIVAHAEDERCVKRGGVAAEGEFAKRNGLIGIAAKSEWSEVERDIRLSKKTGCRVHFCHISTKESVDLIRRAKAEGVRVTAETAPHYLVLSDKDLKNEGRFKMNPPIRGEKDRLALINGLIDGTIDVVATDHAPHSKEEKAGDFNSALFGVVGLEQAFPILYTELVRGGIITLETLIDKMSLSPRRIFGLGGGKIVKGAPTDFTVVDLNSGFTLTGRGESKGCATPFSGRAVFGKVLYTSLNGETVWKSKK